ncbi:PAS domain S-box protein [Halorhabdus salina]|uniref:PAS domain S-box protein n=1 Tax=Halorhabdus salina TaxID=2750670 RepID=UPI0015EF62FE|nr:PAS domain S-box protein [Halorhabdus salina]
MTTDDGVVDAVFERAATPMVVLDADGTVRRLNDRACRILGYDREALCGADWFETIVPEDSDIGLERVLEAVRESGDGAYDVHENTIETADGEMRCIKWHVSGLRDDGDKITQLLVSGSDVTDRVKTERRLRRYEQAIESSTNVLAAIDREYTYLFTNGNYREFHDLGGQELAGQSIADVLGPDQFAEIKPLVDRALAGETVAYETERVGPDGEGRALDVRYFPLVSEEDTIQGVVASMEDITERKERERQRQETLETFEDIFHAINDAVFVHDMDGRFLAVNESACEQLGYEKSELLRMTPWDIDTADRTGAIDDRIETIFEQGSLTFETVHVTKTGERTPVDITSSLVSYFGEEAILSVARDVTERKERERQLTREVDRLEEFASVISHDLRNPLTVAQGRLQLLTDEYDNDDHIGAIERSLDRMESIIEDTLALAREGKTVGETEPIDVDSMIDQCWETVATGRASLSGPESLQIRADRDRLQHVFENLFHNAVEHGGADVSVTVGTLESSEGFFAEDDGPGIPADNREQVFEPGFTTRDEGTGFGLTIVREIADAHGWTVRATESESGGARFEFRDVEIEP